MKVWFVDLVDAIDENDEIFEMQALFRQYMIMDLNM